MRPTVVMAALFALFAAPEPATASERSRDVLVKAKDFGETWPLVVDHGVLRCRTRGPRKMVSIGVSHERLGGEYGLNGAARGNRDVYLDGTKLLKDGLVPAALQPLVDRGLKLCD